MAMVSGIVGSLIGPILDAVIGPVQANKEFARSKHVSNRQMAGAQFLAENQPSWAMQGLENAGVNPILAVTKGVSPAQFAPSVRAPDTPGTSFTGAIERGVSTARQAKMMDESLSLLQSQSREAKNRADASEHLTTRMFAEIGEILARQGLLSEQMQTNVAQRSSFLGSAELSRARALLDRYAAPGARAEAEFYSKPIGEDVKELRPLLELLRVMMQTFKGR